MRVRPRGGANAHGGLYTLTSFGDAQEACLHLLHMSNHADLGVGRHHVAVRRFVLLHRGTLHVHGNLALLHAQELRGLVVVDRGPETGFAGDDVANIVDT